MNFLMMISMTMSMSLLLITHPLSAGMILLIQSITAALITTSMSMYSWFSYIMFLVLVGGMMILFIYMTSVASNEKFSLEKKMIIFPMISLITSIIMIKNFNSSMQLNKITIQNQETIMNLMFIKFWSNPLNSITMFMFIYLLITMIATIKITKNTSGPLRHLN